MERDGLRNVICLGFAVVCLELPASAGNLGFVDCSSEQQATVTAAVQSAGRLADSAGDYMLLRMSSDATRYEEWFGSATRDTTGACGAGIFGSTGKQRVERVRGNVSSIGVALAYDDLIVDCSGTIVLNPESPSCSDPIVIAFVNPAETFKTIYLCPPFWKLDPHGLKSQAGIFVHEVSHFRAVASTRDVKECAPIDCRSFASEDPDGAIQNAYNYQFFAESYDTAATTTGCFVGRGRPLRGLNVVALWLAAVIVLVARRRRARWRPT